ncbi:MAG: TRAP transporter small permease [Melioribacteraceae bacterium]|nr:TRAP transporter small permease [Melioribacteraceae bacterium]MCF8265706.1 TRAP transporter small permease [Melioribacteraceae bacterium]MCF8413543.1 TRAP transporter small permease [Melioribacteraceae bacterium]MCF8432171.1 TRAP transporter small permease [Melioribacteraceae bacterium]
MNLIVLKSKIDNGLKWILVFIMATMTLNVLWQVFSRFVLQNPSSFTEELARYLLIWIGLLGASYVAGQRLHLAIDLLSTKLEGKSKIYLDLFIQSMILLFSVIVMVIGGVRLVYITLSLNQITAALQIPLGYVYTVLPISGLLIVYYTVNFIIEAFNELKSIESADK